MLRGHGLLTPLQRAFIRAFAELFDQQHSFLTGGTALTEFYLAHRVSFDLDFFTSDDLARWPVKMLKPVIPADLKSLFKNIALDIMARIAQPQTNLTFRSFVLQ